MAVLAVELELLLDVLAELVPPPDDADPTRLVEARRAADRLPPPEPEVAGLALDLDAFEVTVAAAVVLDESRLPRPNPPRLPRSCGLMMAAKFSAAVTPVTRTVDRRTPEATAAVRIAEDPPPVPDWAGAFLRIATQ